MTNVLTHHSKHPYFQTFFIYSLRLHRVLSNCSTQTLVTLDIEERNELSSALTFLKTIPQKICNYIRTGIRTSLTQRIERRCYDQ